MKIVKLTAENFKRLVAVEITPEGNTILITGKNEAGKSSVLDAIMSALCGKRYDPPKPIREGQERAEVVVETENWIIKRTWTAKGGGSLTVKNAEGLTASSPQALLDKIVGEIAFDPMNFITCDPKKQRTTLMELVGLDFNDIDEQIATVKQKRSIIKSEKESAQHDLERLGSINKELPTDEINISDLTEKLQKAMEIKIAKEKLESLLMDNESNTIRLTDTFEQYKEHVKQLEDQLKIVKANSNKTTNLLKESMSEHAAIRGEIEESPEADTESIQDDINGIQEKNVEIRRNVQRKELSAKVDFKREEFAAAGLKMKDIEAERSKRLAQVKMPIDKLSVSEDGVLYDRIPLTQVNDAKKLEIGVAISMALNPKLKVIRMKGNDLDSNSLKVVSKMVKDKDYQAWIEKVTDDGDVGIVIEEGQVKK